MQLAQPLSSLPAAEEIKDQRSRAPHAESRSLPRRPECQSVVGRRRADVPVLQVRVQVVGFVGAPRAQNDGGLPSAAGVLLVPDGALRGGRSA